MPKTQESISQRRSRPASTYTFQKLLMHNIAISTRCTYFQPLCVKATFATIGLFWSPVSLGCHFIVIVAVNVCMVEEALREGLEGGSWRPGKDKPKRGSAFRRETRRQWRERHRWDTDVWASEGKDGIRRWRNPQDWSVMMSILKGKGRHDSTINKKHKKRKEKLHV